MWGRIFSVSALLAGIFSVPVHSESSANTQSGFTYGKLPRYEPPTYKKPEVKVPTYSAPAYKTPEVNIPNYSPPEYKHPEGLVPSYSSPVYTTVVHDSYGKVEYEAPGYSGEEYVYPTGDASYKPSGYQPPNYEHEYHTEYKTPRYHDPHSSDDYNPHEDKFDGKRQFHLYSSYDRPVGHGKETKKFTLHGAVMKDKNYQDGDKENTEYETEESYNMEYKKRQPMNGGNGFKDEVSTHTMKRTYSYDQQATKQDDPDHTYPSNGYEPPYNRYHGDNSFNTYGHNQG